MIEISSNIKYLHIIRGFAAFFVVVAHAKWAFWVGGSAYLSEQSFWELSMPDKIGLLLALASSNGTAMVIVFFVLSGFMISYSYKKNNWEYKDFLVNRVLRIYIPYVASMFLAGAVLWLTGEYATEAFLGNQKDYNANVWVAITEGLTVQNFFATLLFYRSDVNYFGFNYVYWSLLYEMVFYLAFPFISRHVAKIFIATLLVYPIHFFLELKEMPYFLLYFSIKFLLYFSCGVYFFQLLSKHGDLKIASVFRSKLVYHVALVGLFLFGIVALGFMTHHSVSFLFAIVFALLWMYYILKLGVQNNLVSRLFFYFGTISYSWYLTHVPVLLTLYVGCYLAFDVLVYESPWIHLVFVLLTIPLAHLFYFIFEKISIQFINKHKGMVQANVQTNVASKNNPQLQES